MSGEAATNGISRTASAGVSSACSAAGSTGDVLESHPFREIAGMGLLV